MERRWIDPLRLFISQIAFAMACRRSTHWRWASSQAIGMDYRAGAIHERELQTEIAFYGRRGAGAFGRSRPEGTANVGFSNASSQLMQCLRIIFAI